MMELLNILTTAKERDASDIHLATGSPPIFRIYGELVPMQMGPLDKEQVEMLLYSVMTEDQQIEFKKNLEIDFAFMSHDCRYRVNFFHSLRGFVAVLRHVPVRIRTLKELGAPSLFEKFTLLENGLILVTGPTGSGKSTTVAAMIHHMNQDQARHIITIEDPIEFVHSSQKSLINQREVGVHTHSFARSLKSALREDPDVIMLGELRDLETIHLALTAAETGHLVIGTLHTSSAAQTIDRVIDVFPSEDKPMIRMMLSNTLEAVICQTLVRTIDHSGRVAAYEIMVATHAIRNLVREGKTPQMNSLIQVGSKVGMRLMRDSVLELVNQKRITKEAARALFNQNDQDGALSSNLSGGF
jgi:twitching motility protein PilT